MTTATKGRRISLTRGPRTENELYYLVQALWGHTIPRHKICPEHDAPFEAFAHAYFARDPQILIHGSRGLAGKSRLLSILGLTQAAVLGADVNILGGSLAQSTNIHETMRDAWEYEHSPRYLIRGDATQGLIELQNNAKIRPLTASQRTVRGPHPARLLLDEIDEMDEAILNAAFGQPMPQKNWKGEIVSAQTTMASTWQYPDGTFAKQLKRFHEENLPVFTWCAAGLLTGVITQRGTVDITEVTIDDLVLTRQGLKPVQHVTYMGDKECVEVRTSDDRVVTVTADHKIFTSNRGWVEAGLLCSKDRLAVLEAGAAMSSVVPRVPVSVGVGVDVPMRTVGSAHLLDGARGEFAVLPASHGDKMLGVATSTASASQFSGVVKSRSGDGANLPEIDQPMNDLFIPLVASSDSPVATSIGAASPNPATVIVADDVRLQPLVADDKTLSDVGARTASDGFLTDGLPTIETVHIVSVTPADIHPTYDIGVYGAHEFTANGVLVHNCFRETSNPIDGWLDPDFIEQKKREIPAEMWRVEYELGEPSIGNRAFDSDAVKKMFEKKMPSKEDCLTYKVAKDYEEYQFEKYSTGEEYVIGADWAKAKDFTVIAVYKVTMLPAKLVYFCKMRRRPYPVMVGKYNTIMRRFKAEGIHDATGLGGVIEDYIDDRAYGFMMTGAKRDDMLSNYVNAVEKGVVEAPLIESVYKSHLYCSVEDLFARGKEFHLPDDVCAMALAWHLVHRRVGTVGPEVLEYINDPNWIEKEIAHNKQHDPRNQKKNTWSVGQVERKDQEDNSNTLLV